MAAISFVAMLVTLAGAIIVLLAIFADRDRKQSTI